MISSLAKTCYTPPRFVRAGWVKSPRRLPESPMCGSPSVSPAGTRAGRRPLRRAPAPASQIPSPQRRLVPGTRTPRRAKAKRSGDRRAGIASNGARGGRPRWRSEPSPTAARTVRVPTSRRSAKSSPRVTHAPTAEDPDSPKGLRGAGSRHDVGSEFALLLAWQSGQLRVGGRR